MKPESRLRLSIEKHLKPEVHCEKMANPWRGGTADSWYDGNKADMWVEWKWLAALPKRPTTMIVPDLSKLQEGWLGARWANGRKVFVVVGSPEGCIVFSTPGEWKFGLVRSGVQLLSKQEVATWIRGNVTETDRKGGVRS